MTDYLDSHTHTLASGRAYSTINDNIAAAKRAGLSLLAITEHGPDMDGACRPMHFQNLRVMPRRYGELTVLFGAELNILNLYIVRYSTTKNENRTIILKNMIFLYMIKIDTYREEAFSWW